MIGLLFICINDIYKINIIIHDKCCFKNVIEIYSLSCINFRQKSMMKFKKCLNQMLLYNTLQNVEIYYFLTRQISLLHLF